MSARENILQRIRDARSSRDAVDVEATILHPVPGPQPAPYPNVVERFTVQAQKLGSEVQRVRHWHDIPGVVATYLETHDLGMQALCWPEWLDLEWMRYRMVVAAQPVTAEDPVGITGVFCAIAETGTLMLTAGPDTPAATSILPETHIALVDATRIVSTMEQAWAGWRNEQGALPRSVNFVSGPSRTADIEQTVTLGAHGPARVLIIIIG